MNRANLIELPAFNRKSGCWHAVIETPQGSRHKFDFDPDFGCFVLKKTLPQGMTFPLDFGFIPSTLADDGDAIDVLVALDFPAQMGALVKVRLVGAIKAEQKEKGEDWQRNDRLIAVAAHNDTLAGIISLDALRPQQLDQLIQFFERSNKLEGKKFRWVGNSDAKDATALARKAMKKRKESE